MRSSEVTESARSESNEGHNAIVISLSVENVVYLLRDPYELRLSLKHISLEVTCESE